MKTIGTIVSGNIRTRMKELGLTQETLAKRMGVKQPTVSSWVRGEVVPEGTTQERLCKALECKLERLLLVDRDDVLVDKLDVLASRMVEIELLLHKTQNISQDRASLLRFISTLDESQVSLALTALQATFSGNKINVSTKINK